MVRTTALLSLLAVLVVCSGCLAADSPGAPTAEGTGTTTATTTATTVPSPSTPTTTAADTATETASYADCPYHLSVEVAGENPDTRDETVVAYADLAEPRRTEFDRALREVTIELGQEPNGWIDRRFVRKDGVVYRTGVMIC